VATCAPRALVALVALGVASCGEERSRASGYLASPGDVESIWLQRIGVGPAQTAAACAQGAADPVALALCQSPPPALTSLSDLYRLLTISPGIDGDVAVTTHSLGLTARTVSALNPRTFAFRKYSRLTPDRTSAVAFSRGEARAELVGYDPVANAFRFYLLAFRPKCGTEANGACRAADFLSERIESGWLDWTLYTERDLQDTPLDCTSCHRPGGEHEPARLLMRQIQAPWLHWGDFRGTGPMTSCPEVDGNEVWVDGEVTADGADLLRQIDGPDGTHGGIPVASLVLAPSGYDLSTFIYYAAGYADGPGDIPCLAPDCPFSEPQPFPSRQVLCDRLQLGSAEVAGGAWEAYRSRLLQRGFPVPYFAPEVLSESVRSTAAERLASFDAGAGDAFSALSGLLSEEVSRAIGFLPDLDDSATDILTKMCVRCHSDTVDAELAKGRSRFNALSLSRLDPAVARKVGERLRLPRTSPERMPPLRSGELPEWALVRVEEFLRSR
jgi:hypothetical protein